MLRLQGKLPALACPEDARVPTEADACRIHVVPALHAAGWGDDRIREQHYFTDGRIIVAGTRTRRGKRKFADYLPLAVVEAAYGSATDGLEQAKDYARVLGVPLAYATNDPEIVEYDDLTTRTTPIAAYPSPDDLWARLRAARGLDTDAAVAPLVQPDYPTPGWAPRYYQRIAID